MLRLTSEVIAEDLFRDAPKFEWENRRRENSSRKEPEWVSEWNAEDFAGLHVERRGLFPTNRDLQMSAPDDSADVQGAGNRAFAETG